MTKNWMLEIADLALNNNKPLGLNLQPFFSFVNLKLIKERKKLQTVTGQKETENFGDFENRLLRVWRE